MEKKDLKILIQESLRALPPTVQQAIASINFGDIMMKIQKKHSLTLDKASDLEIETMIIMLGLDEPENFIDNLTENLGINQVIASEIEKDLNSEIFSKIRHKMMEEEEKTQAPEALDRDSILNEIENPTPTFPTVEAKQTITQAPQSPKTQSNIPEIAPVHTLQKYTIPPQTKSVIERKLSEPTHVPPKETEISLKKIPKALNNSISQSQKPAQDPYKEPI